MPGRSCPKHSVSCLQLLLSLSKKAQLKEKINGMFGGEHLNVTEDRAALHVALRAPREEVSLMGPICLFLLGCM